MTWFAKLFHWMTCSPGPHVGFDGCSMVSRCEVCGLRILQDSGGSWFPANPGGSDSLDISASEMEDGGFMVEMANGDATLVFVTSEDGREGYLTVLREGFMWAGALVELPKWIRWLRDPSVRVEIEGK